MLTKPKMVPFLPFLSLFLSYYMRHHLFLIVTHFTKEAGEWCSDLWLSCAIHVMKTDASLLNLIGIKHVLMVTIGWVRVHKSGKTQQKRFVIIN